MEWGFSILRDEDSALKTKSIPFSVHGIKFINCCIRGLRDNFDDVTVYFLQNREIPRPFGGQVYLHSDWKFRFVRNFVELIGKKYRGVNLCYMKEIKEILILLPLSRWDLFWHRQKVSRTRTTLSVASVWICHFNCAFEFLTKQLSNDQRPHLRSRSATTNDQRPTTIFERWSDGAQRHALRSWPRSWLAELDNLSASWVAVLRHRVHIDRE